jgi:CBS domain-containing protein
MLTVRDIMATDMVTIGADADLRQAIDILVRHRVSGAPVVEDGIVAGVVSATDLLEFMRSPPPESPRVPTAAVIWKEGQGAPGAYYVEWWTGDGADTGIRLQMLGDPERDRLRRHTVAEVMSRSLCAVRADATVTSAAEYLLRAGVHRVLVLEGGKLVGILTTTDYVRAVAQGRLGETATAPGRARAGVTAGA